MNASKQVFQGRPNVVFGFGRNERPSMNSIEVAAKPGSISSQRMSNKLEYGLARVFVL